MSVLKTSSRFLVSHTVRRARTKTFTDFFFTDSEDNIMRLSGRRRSELQDQGVHARWDINHNICHKRRILLAATCAAVILVVHILPVLRRSKTLCVQNVAASVRSVVLHLISIPNANYYLSD